MSGDWRSKLRNGEGQKLSETFKDSKVLMSSIEDLTKSSTGSLGPIESKEYLQLIYEQKSRFVPKMDFSDPAKFVKFASAEQYYKDSITRIYNTYPYDGTHTEKLKWLLESSYLDLYLYNVEYPKTTGYVNFKPNGWGNKSAGTTYGLSDKPEYIFLNGGPNADPSGNFKTGKPNKYSPSEKRESNLAITRDGNTVEFWLKKDSLVSSSKTSREVLFDCSTSQFEVGHGSHARLRIELDTTGQADHWLVSLVSGSSEVGVKNLSIGTSAKIADTSWHHHAFTFSHASDDLIVKYFNDGVLNEKKVTNLGATFSEIPVNLVAAIGALSTHSTSDKSVDNLGHGQMSGSLDEFRFWKTARNEKQIGLHYDLVVHGGTNESLENVDLGVYYKFNEGITLTSSVDQSILDYSGRITNGSFVGYSSLTRNTGSAITSHTGIQEPADPILYSFHPDVKQLYDSKLIIGRHYDYTNSAAILNTLPSWILDEGLNPIDGGRSTLKELTQIVASYFDTLFFQISHLPQLKAIQYEEFNNIDTSGSLKPYPFMDKILSSFSFNSADIFSELDTTEKVLNRDDSIRFGRDMTEIKNFIFKNIYNNLTYIYKSKGTEAAFRNFIRCFGVGREILDIASYADNYKYKLEDKFIETTNKTKSINFLSTNNSEASVFQGTGAFTGCIDYVPGLVSPAGHTISYSVNMNAPASISSVTFEKVPATVLSSSIFGVVTPLKLNESDTSTDLTGPDLRLYLVREVDTSPDAQFVVESTSMDTRIISPVISKIYDDKDFNVVVSIGPTGKDFGSHVSGSSDFYTLTMRGMSYMSDLLEESFEVTDKIPKNLAESFLSSNKRHYVGAEKLNLTGSIIGQRRSDVKVISFRKYLAPITKEEQRYHAIDSEVFGLNNPMKDVNLFIDDGSNYELNKYNSLVLNWGFNQVTSSDSLGSFGVYDLSSKTAGFGQVDNITSNEYPGLGHNFVENSSVFVSPHFTSIARQSLPETMFSSDMVQINTSEEGSELFTKSSRPIVRQFAFEKNMYKTISHEMMKFMGSAAALGDLVGDPVNKYRKEYKDLNKLRQHFFKFVNNDMDLEKFLTYYRWLDSSISKMIDQLKPATVEFSEDIRSMIESHVFERNKYEHKFPTIEFAPQTPEASIFGITELLYDWEHGHAPAPIQGTPAAASGSIQFISSMTSHIDGGTITITDHNNLEKVYIFDDDGDGATGTVDGSDRIRVQISGFLKDSWATQLKNAIHGATGHDGSITVTGPGLDNPQDGKIILTQSSTGISGNNTISSTVGGSYINILGFEGGDDGNERPNEIANCLWWKDRAERNETSSNNVASAISTGNSLVDNNREMIRQFVNSDVSGSTYATRRFAKTYRLTIERDTIYKVGPNFDKANKIINLHDDAVEYETSIDLENLKETDQCQDNPEPNRKERLSGPFQTSLVEEYLTGDIDFVMPFSIHSSSVNTGYVMSPLASGESSLRSLHPSAIITNLHNDTVSSDGETALQGPFTYAHVGGNTHRHVQPLTAEFAGDTLADRPEEFEIAINTNKIKFKSPSKRRSFKRNVRTKRPVNIANIKSQLTTSSLGNYLDDYEVVMVATDRANGDQAFFPNNFLSGTFHNKSVYENVVDYVNNTGSRDNHLIISRFSRIGGTTWRRNYLSDPLYGDLSPYNTVAYSNQKAKAALDSLEIEHASQFGLRSGSVVVGNSDYHITSAFDSSTPRHMVPAVAASTHKVNKNTVYRLDENNKILSKRDNFKVSSHIPRSDLQYLWISKATSGVLSTGSYFGHESTYSIPTGSSSSFLNSLTFHSASQFGIATNEVLADKFYLNTSDDGSPKIMWSIIGAPKEHVLGYAHNYNSNSTSWPYDAVAFTGVSVKNQTNSGLGSSIKAENFESATEYFAMQGGPDSDGGPGHTPPGFSSGDYATNEHGVRSRYRPIAVYVQFNHHDQNEVQWGPTQLGDGDTYTNSNKAFTMTDGGSGNSVTFTYTQCSGECAAANQLNYAADGESWTVDQAATELAKKINNSILKIYAKATPRYGTSSRAAVMLSHHIGLTQAEVTTQKNSNGNVGGISITAYMPTSTPTSAMVGISTGGYTGGYSFRWTAAANAGYDSDTGLFFNYGDKYRDIPDPDPNYVNKALIFRGDTTSGTTNASNLYDKYSIPDPPFHELADISGMHAALIQHEINAGTNIDPRYPGRPFKTSQIGETEWSWVTDDRTYTEPVSVSFKIRVGNYDPTSAQDTGDPYILKSNPWVNDQVNTKPVRWPQSLWFQYKVGTTGDWVTPTRGRFDNYKYLSSINRKLNDLTSYDLPLEKGQTGTINYSSFTGLGGGPGTTKANKGGSAVADRYRQVTLYYGSGNSPAQFDTTVMNIDDQVSFTDNTGSITFTYKDCSPGGNTPSTGFTGCAAANELHVRTGTYNFSTNTWTDNQAATELATKLNNSSLNIRAKQNYDDVYIAHNSHKDTGELVSVNEDPNGTNTTTGRAGTSDNAFYVVSYPQMAASQYDDKQVVVDRFVEAGDEVFVLKASDASMTPANDPIIWRGIVTALNASTNTMTLTTEYSSGEALNSDSNNFVRVLRVRKDEMGVLDQVTAGGPSSRPEGHPSSDHPQQFGEDWVPQQFFINAGQDESNQLHLRWIRLNRDDSYNDWAIDDIEVKKWQPYLPLYPYRFEPFDSAGLNRGLVLNIDADTQTSSPAFAPLDLGSNLLLTSVSTSSFERTLAGTQFTYKFTSSYDFYPASPISNVDTDLRGPTFSSTNSTNVANEPLGIHLNSYIYNKLSKYGFSSWNQIRKDNNKIASLNRKNNIMSITFDGDENPTRFVEPPAQQDTNVFTIADLPRPIEYIDQIDEAIALNNRQPEEVRKHKFSSVNPESEAVSSLEPSAGRAFREETGFQRFSWLTLEDGVDINIVNSVVKNIWNSGYNPMLSLRGLKAKHSDFFHLGQGAQEEEANNFRFLRGDRHAVASASYSYSDPHFANENIASKIKERLNYFDRNEEIFVRHQLKDQELNSKLIKMDEFVDLYDGKNSKLIQAMARTWPPPEIEGLATTRKRKNYTIDNRVEYETPSEFVPYSNMDSWETTETSDMIYVQDFNDVDENTLPDGWKTYGPITEADSTSIYPHPGVATSSAGGTRRVLALRGNRQMMKGTSGQTGSVNGAFYDYATDSVLDPPRNKFIFDWENAVTSFQLAVPSDNIRVTDPQSTIGYRWVEFDNGGNLSTPFYITFEIYAGTAADTDPYGLSSPDAKDYDGFDSLWFQYRVKTALNDGNEPTYSTWTTIEEYVNHARTGDFAYRSSAAEVHSTQDFGKYSGRFTTKKYLIDYGQTSSNGKTIELRWICNRNSLTTSDQGDDWAIDNVRLQRASERNWLNYSGFHSQQNKNLNLETNTSCGIDAVDVEVQLVTNIPDGENLNLANKNHITRNVQKIRSQISPWPMSGRTNYGIVSSSNPIPEFYPTPIHNPDYFIWSLKKVENPIYDGYLVEKGSYATGSGAKYQDYFYRPGDPNGSLKTYDTGILSRLGLPMISYSSTFPEPFLFKNDRKHLMYHFKYVDTFYYGSPSRLAGTTARFEPTTVSSVSRGATINEYGNFVVNSSSLDTRGLRGQGELQNDYTIYHMGVSSLYVTPPPGMLYSRPVPQTIWSAPEHGSIPQRHQAGDPIALSYDDEAHNNFFKAGSGHASTLRGITGSVRFGSGEDVVVRYKTTAQGLPLIYSNFYSGSSEQGVERGGHGLKVGDIVRFYDPLHDQVSPRNRYFEATCSAVTKPYGHDKHEESRIVRASIPDQTGLRGFQVLSGDAKWEAAEQSGLTPRYKDYDSFRENFRSLEQNKSLVPEFIMASHVEDFVSGNQTYEEFKNSFITVASNPGDPIGTRSLDIRNEDSLSLTGSAIAEEGIQEFYTTAELSSSFGIHLSSFNSTHEMTRITLRANAIKKLLPYKGFYPSERLIQIGNIFQKDYLNPGSQIPGIAQRPLHKQFAQKSIVDLKISASLSPAMKPLFGPGIMFNSIKSGLAVDYPMFKNVGTGSMEIGGGLLSSGSSNQSFERLPLTGASGERHYSIDPPSFMNPYGLHPYDNSNILSLMFLSGTAGQSSTAQDGAATESNYGYSSFAQPWGDTKIRGNTGNNYGTAVTGSSFNHTLNFILTRSVDISSYDTIPKLKPGSSEGDAYRIPFEAIYEPFRLNSLPLYDNEPHPSASYAIGGYNYWKIMDFPFTFNQINTDQLQDKFKFQAFKNSSNFSSYTLAMNNFLAESVDIYNESGRISSLRSAPSKDWALAAGENPNHPQNKWAMRVYIQNKFTQMYDRDTAFGPPVHSETKLLNNEKALFDESGAVDSIILTSSIDNIFMKNSISFASKTGSTDASPGVAREVNRLDRNYVSDYNLTDYNFIVTYGKETFVLKFFDSTGVHPTAGGAAGAYGGVNYYLTASNLVNEYPVTTNRNANAGGSETGTNDPLDQFQDTYGVNRSGFAANGNPLEAKTIRIYKDSNKFNLASNTTISNNSAWQKLRRNCEYIAAPVSQDNWEAADWKLAFSHQTLNTSASPFVDEPRVFDRWIGFEPGITTMTDALTDLELKLSQIVEYFKKYRIPSGSYLNAPEELTKTSIYHQTHRGGLTRAAANTGEGPWPLLASYGRDMNIAFPVTFETHPYLVEDTAYKALHIKMTNNTAGTGPGNLLYSMARRRYPGSGTVLERSFSVYGGTGIINLTGSGDAAGRFIEIAYDYPQPAVSVDLPQASPIGDNDSGYINTQHVFALNTSELSASYTQEEWTALRGQYKLTPPTMTHIGIADTDHPFGQISSRKNRWNSANVYQYGTTRYLGIPISRLRTSVGLNGVGHDYMSSEEFFHILADGINRNSGSLGVRARAYRNYKNISRYDYLPEGAEQTYITSRNDNLSPFSYQSYLKIEALDPGTSGISVVLSSTGSLNKIFGPLKEEARSIPREYNAADRIQSRAIDSTVPWQGSTTAARNYEKATSRHWGSTSNSLYKSLNSSDYIYLGGGREAKEDVEKSIDVQSNWSYDPYVPPFLKPLTALEDQAYIDLVVNYSSVVDPQAPVNDPAFILQHLEYTSSYSKKDYSSLSGPAADHAMSISASLNLETIVPDLTNPQIVNPAESPKVWVISPKWETPILDFSNSKQTVQRIFPKDIQGNEAWENGEYQLLEEQHLTPPYSGINPDKLYITSSKGMWHQYSSENEGYDLIVTSHPDTDKYQDLALALGFIDAPGQQNITKLGKVRGSSDTSKKIISEALVAIPYQKYIDVNNTAQYKTIPFVKMKEGRPGNPITSHEFINIMESLVRTRNNQIVPNEEIVNNIRLDVGIQSQIELMDRYILPPQYDFLKFNRDDQETAVMFIMPFYHQLTDLDVINWWQNLPPDIARNPQISNSYATHALYESDGLIDGDINALTAAETIMGLTSDIIFDNLKWKVFKVKQKARTSYHKKLLDSHLGVDFDNSRSREILENSLGRTVADGSEVDSLLRRKRGVSWNWPYDYFSLIELVNVEAKINLEKEPEKPQYGISESIYNIAKKMIRRGVDFANVHPGPGE